MLALLPLVYPSLNSSSPPPRLSPRLSLLSSALFFILIYLSSSLCLPLANPFSPSLLPPDIPTPLRLPTSSAASSFSCRPCHPRYYDRKYTELTLDLDDGLVKEYFPVARVVPAVLQIYQDLLGVEFKTIEGEVWHPGEWSLLSPHPPTTLFGWDVIYFVPLLSYLFIFSRILYLTHLNIPQRWSNTQYGKREQRMRRAFWDMLTLISSREVSIPCDLLSPNISHITPSRPDDKYSHAAVWPLIPGYAVDTPPTRIYPVAAMVANLAKVTPERPDALMRHDDVVTFFHEMGHMFHELLSRVRFARFHGTT